MEQASVTLPVSAPALWANPKAYLALATIFFVSALIGSFIGAPILLSVALVVGIAAVVLLFQNPLVLLAALVVFRMSLDYSAQYVTLSLFNYTLSLSQLLGLGIAGLGILFILSRGRALGHYPLTLPYLLIILWGLGTMSYSISPMMSAQEARRIFDLFIVGFMAYASVERYRDYRFLLLPILLSSLIPILFGLGQFFLGIGLADENVSAIRIFGTFSHPNVFSLYLFAVAAVASIYSLVYARKDNARLLMALYLGLVLFTLLLTYARIAWVALFIFALLVAVWRYRFLLFPLILLPLVLTTFVPAVNQRVTEALHPTPDSSIVWRQTLWNDMLLKTNLENRTLLGSGLDTFRVSAEQLRGERFGSNESHNDFVKFYVDGGLIGLAIFGLFLALFFFPISTVRRLTPSHSLKNMAVLLSLFLLTLIIASFSDNVFKNTPVQWILSIVVGGFLALYRLSLPVEARAL